MRTLTATLALSVLLAGLSGCSVSYSAEVRNATRTDLRVRLVQDQVAADPIELESATLPAGSTIVVGPVEAPLTDPVKLSIEAVRDRGNVPKRQTLSRGASRYIVEYLGDPTYGALDVRLVDHSTPFRLGISSDDGALD